MLRCVISGYGYTSIGEHWEKSVSQLGAAAVRAAMRNAEVDVESIDVLIVGNMLSGVLNRQENMGACIADQSGLRGVEAMKVEAACASGAAALKAGYAIIRSGLASNVAVVAVEKMTDSMPEKTLEGLAYANDFETETLVGATNTAIAALLTSAYATEYGIDANAFAKFTVHARSKAVATEYAMFRKPLSLESWKNSSEISPPVRLFDCPAICDGAAAVILTSGTTCDNESRISIQAIEGATDSLAVTNRSEMLRMTAVSESVTKALKVSGLSISDVDFFEPHDAFPVIAAISLEESGFADRGRGWDYLDSAHAIPVLTMGGIKGKGHPVGATGLYQVVDACIQLQNRAGSNQISRPSIAMTQCLGGAASNAYTTVLAKGGHYA